MSAGVLGTPLGRVFFWTLVRPLNELENILKNNPKQQKNNNKRNDIYTVS